MMRRTMRYVDGTKIKESLTCARLPYLAFHTPREDELPPTERMEVLFEAGRRLEDRLLEGIGPEEVVFPRGDWDAGFEATLDAIDRKVPVIANGVLKLGEFLGRPDLLVFREEEGRYEVADVKSAQVVHASARLQVAFYSRLLGQVRPTPRRGWVIVRDGTRVGFEVADLMASVERLLDRLQRYRRGPAHDPGPHHDDVCLDCRYREVCFAELEDRDDPSFVPGITRAQVAALRAAGIETLERLADPPDLRRVVKESGLATDTIRRLARGARAMKDGAPVRFGAVRREVETAKLAVVALLEERQTDATIAVAGQVLGRDDAFRVRYLRAPEAERPDEEFRTFVFNLAKTEGPVLTYGPAVARLLDRLVLTAPKAIETVHRLRDRLVDVKAELRRSVALPGPDRLPHLAARAAGVAAYDDAVDLELLRYLEGFGGTKDAIERRLARDVDALVRLRAFALEGGVAEGGGP
ncbi:MAG: TM0106 family RecB-like putative nuclease [Planctomycetota bacterium JB042]